MDVRCSACEGSPFPTCSFHRVSYFDLDDTAERELTRVRFVPCDDDDELVW